MRDKPVVVFVDDNADELDLFREVFQDYFSLVLAQSAQEAMEILGGAGKTPKLILLDVYIPEHGKDREVSSSIAEKIIEMPPDHGELRLAYNNMQLAQARFKELQEARAHGVKGGLKLARIFSQKFPEIPLIGYSRKSSPLECLIYLATIPTAVDFIQKPNDPRGWSETRELTLAECPRLLARFHSCLAGGRIDRLNGDSAQSLLQGVDYLGQQALLT